MYKIYSIFLLIAITSCQSQSQDLDILFSFPKQQKEISGLVFNPKDQLLYTLEDKGNPNEIYVFSELGKLENTIKIENTQNTDWEDLTIDANGNLYVGNFGNNNNERQDLSIYKIPENTLNLNATSPSQITTFSYAEQTEFPPKKKDLMYDCEAFVEINDSFYLFTKNRSKGFNGSFYVYKIPNKPGNFKAERIAELNSGKSYDRAAITGASFDINSKQIALVTHTKVLLIPFTDDNSFKQENITTVELNHNSQKESVTFKDANTLYIADEKENKNDIGGNVYKFKIPN